MRTRVTLSVFLVSALLVTCLLSWPSSANASGGGVGFQIKVRGGLSYLSPRDVNAGCGGFFTYYRILVEEMGGTASGDYHPLHLGSDFGADFILQLSPNIGIGIGAGYLGSSKTTVMTAALEAEEVTLTGTPKLSAMPVRLALFFTFPLGKKLSVTADAGAAYYAALKFEAELRGESAGGWFEQSISASRSSLSGNLGFQGSLGFEYTVAHNLGIFIEGMARYARFKNFDVATTTNQESGSALETDEGRIYLANYDITQGTFSMFEVSADDPIPYPPELTYSEPKFDLSGFSLQAGIRIRF